MCHLDSEMLRYLQSFIAGTQHVYIRPRPYKAVLYCGGHAHAFVSLDASAVYPSKIRFRIPPLTDANSCPGGVH
jgi:hypothetical protein